MWVIGIGHSLAAGTSVPPDIPGALDARIGSDSADLGGRDSLVLAVIPFPHILRHLDPGAALLATRLTRAVRSPRQVPRNTQIHQLECPLGTFSRRHVSAMRFFTAGQLLTNNPMVRYASGGEA